MSEIDHSINPNLHEVRLLIEGAIADLSSLNDRNMRAIEHAQETREAIAEQIAESDARVAEPIRILKLAGILR